MGAKICYARLAQYAGKDGVAFPRCSVLADEIGVGDRQIKRYLNELKALGLIDVVKQGQGRPNLYYFFEHEWMPCSGDRQSTPNEVTDMSPQEIPREDISVTSNDHHEVCTPLEEGLRSDGYVTSSGNDMTYMSSQNESRGDICVTSNGHEGTDMSPQDRTDMSPLVLKESSEDISDSDRRVREEDGPPNSRSPPQPAYPGDIVKLLTSRGLPVAYVTKPDAVSVINELIASGATQEDFERALDKAYRSKQGKPFGVFYLQPIVGQLTYQRIHGRRQDAPSRQGRKQSGADFIAADCETWGEEPEETGAIIDGESG